MDVATEVGKIYIYMSNYKFLKLYIVLSPVRNRNR